MEDYLLAGSKLLSLAEARKLSQNVSPRVRCKLAANPNCPNIVLHILSKDLNVEVRAAVGLNPSCDDSLLDLLVADQSLTVRFQIAGNSRLGEKRLKLLMNDCNPYVAERALATYETSLLEEHLAKLNLPPTESRPLLGQLLLEAGLLSASDLKFALAEAAKLRIPLGNLLVAKRMASRYVLVEALLVQNLIGQNRLRFEEGVYYLKREAKIDSANMFKPRSMPHMQQHTG